MKIIGLVAVILIAGCSVDDTTPDQLTEAGPDDRLRAENHFDDRGLAPSRFTVDKQTALRESLPFDDERDFEEFSRGFIARPDSGIIRNAEGVVVWDMDRYAFLAEDKIFDSMHPSLQRQAILNMAFGLYQVTENIYQVRGFDLSNITFVMGDEGWIVIDPLTASETAAAALKLVNKTLGNRPIKAVIYSHSHIDHFGGVRGIVDEQDVIDGKVEIIAPIGFMEHAVAENVYAGNAMARRSWMQYGQLLPASPYGHVDQSIGKRVSVGTIGLIAPTIIIEDDFEELTIDGVKMVFQNTPGTEAPAEMNTYFPEWKAFWAAENITGTIHNIYTLRGALVRDALEWSKQINEALYRFGKDTEVMFASHSWPRWGNDRVQEVMRCQRDAYAHLNNQVLHHANMGVTINEIHNVYEPPQSLQQQWCARGYHGSYEHNSKAVINRYLGYWDANPATLIPLSPADSAPLYVDMMGGSDAIIARAKALATAGKYLLAMEILNKLVYAEAENVAAKYLLADVFEQLGYQHESPSVRNSYLSAAYELRNGIPTGASARTDAPDLRRAMTTGQFLDFIGIRMDSEKAEGMEFTINFISPDVDESYVLEMSNGALTNIKGQLDDDADLTITVNRSDLEMVLSGEAQLTSLITGGVASLEGNPLVLGELMSTLVAFPPRFEIMPGTASAE